MRIAKFLASQGICSRRQAESLIEKGIVCVNGEILQTPVYFVNMQDHITVDGKKIGFIQNDSQNSFVRLWAYHKPRGLITTHQDPQGRKTVFQDIKKFLGDAHVISVGRLDFNSEGLMLITNQGILSRYFESPEKQFLRVYRIRVFGCPSVEMLEDLQKGVSLEGIHYSPFKILEYPVKNASNVWLTLGLTEGKNREIRRIFEHFGYPVSRLIRVSYGPFQLGSLKSGELQEMSLPFFQKYIDAPTWEKLMTRSSFYANQ